MITTSVSEGIMEVVDIIVIVKCMNKSTRSLVCVSNKKTCGFYW